VSASGARALSAPLCTRVRYELAVDSRIIAALVHEAAVCAIGLGEGPMFVVLVALFTAASVHVTVGVGPTIAGALVITVVARSAISDHTLRVPAQSKHAPRALRVGMRADVHNGGDTRVSRSCRTLSLLHLCKRGRLTGTRTCDTVRCT
jgi:hypothetical protein